MWRPKGPPVAEREPPSCPTIAVRSFSVKNSAFNVQRCLAFNVPPPSAFLATEITSLTDRRAAKIFFCEMSKWAAPARHRGDGTEWFRAKSTTSIHDPYENDWKPTPYGAATGGTAHRPRGRHGAARGSLYDLSLNPDWQRRCDGVRL